MKTTITQNEYLQIVGLMTLARNHQKIVDDCNDAMSEIVGDDEKYSLLTDAMYDSTDVDTALKNMNITVELTVESEEL